jgi:alpha-galactosidase
MEFTNPGKDPLYTPDSPQRREFLARCAQLALLGSFADQETHMLPPPSSEITLLDGSPAPSTLTVTLWHRGKGWRYHLHNKGTTAVRIKEVRLLSLPHSWPTATRLYGEGFQMLSQTGGTLGQPEALGGYTDAKHYRLPQTPGATTVYGMLTLTPPDEPTHLYAFTSCRRFSGRFCLFPDRLDAIVDTEGLELAPDETWVLEDLVVLKGHDRAKLLETMVADIRHTHPPLSFKAPPTGWCSWYCFGPDVTEKQVLDNLDVIATSVPELRYVQIDDGYESAMGDWLETGTAFGGGVQGVLKKIREKGFEPAIWVGPFIAEAASQVFQNHPDWFIKNAEGKPLPSDKVTFGGWRHGPWYALDGTHPEVQQHLETVFRTMREEWGCAYFKLDANFWGAMQGGHFHDPHATRIEAYRRGMAAILRGAGDSFLLGCNHPIWPSFGLIHGSRSSNDISRDWNTFAHTARENLSRNWQNGQLWWNDPDCAVLTGALTDDEFHFHATALYATGGMLLSGDDLTRLPPERLAILKKLLPPTGVAARFEDETLRIGAVILPDRRVLCLFNWQDTPQTLSVRLPHPYRLRDFWTDADLGIHHGTFETGPMPPHSARLIICQR